MKFFLSIVFTLLFANAALANFIEVAKVNRTCPNNAVIKQNGEYFSVRTAGCFLLEGMEGNSSPALRISGTSLLRFTSGSPCHVVLVYESRLFPPRDDEDFCY